MGLEELGLSSCKGRGIVHHSLYMFFYILLHGYKSIFDVLLHHPSLLQDYSRIIILFFHNLLYTVHWVNTNIEIFQYMYPLFFLLCAQIGSTHFKGTENYPTGWSHLWPIFQTIFVQAFTWLYTFPKYNVWMIHYLRVFYIIMS